jgi:hypothetical protein
MHYRKKKGYAVFSISIKYRTLIINLLLVTKMGLGFNTIQFKSFIHVQLNRN